MRLPWSSASLKSSTTWPPTAVTASRSGTTHRPSRRSRLKNALTAAIRLFLAVDGWRQHLPADTRVHGIITKGGAASNIIPDLAECDFGLRAADLGVLAPYQVHGEPAGEVSQRPWGERSFYVVDPWGNDLCFCQDGTLYR